MAEKPTGLGIKGLAEAGLKKAGIPFETTITERQSQDHYTELNKIKKFAPDLVLAFVYGFGVHYLIAQANEVGLVPQTALLVEGAGPPSLWPEFWKTVGEAGKLEIFVSCKHKDVLLTPVAKEVPGAYQKKFGKAHTITSPAQSSTCSWWPPTRSARSTDREKLVEALEKTDLTVGSGQVRFGATPGSYRYHHSQPPMLLIQWQVKEQKVIYPQQAATGELKRK